MQSNQPDALTVRDQIAISAMSAMLASPNMVFEEADRLAAVAYEAADAMLAQREKQTES